MDGGPNRMKLFPERLECSVGVDGKHHDAFLERNLRFLIFRGRVDGAY